jgi:hypothetical protein
MHLLTWLGQPPELAEAPAAMRALVARTVRQRGEPPGPMQTTTRAWLVPWPGPGATTRASMRRLLRTALQRGIPWRRTQLARPISEVQWPYTVTGTTLKLYDTLNNRIGVYALQ